MDFGESVALSSALAMDCFSVAVACGMAERRFNLRQALPMSLLFGLFQALMPLAGWASTTLLYGHIEEYAQTVAFVLLVLVGMKMIRDSFDNRPEKKTNLTRTLTIIWLAIATSIDALAIGATFTCMGMRDISTVGMPVAIIGIGSFLLSLAGKAIGAFAGRRFRINAGAIGGVVLILLGFKTLIQ